jgi:hypothetical protein
MAQTTMRDVNLIRTWDEVPEFESEASEAEFWATHGLGLELLARMGPVPDGDLPPARPVT